MAHPSLGKLFFYLKIIHTLFQEVSIKTILLVEDEILIGMATSKLLKNFQYEVIFVNSAEKAIETVRKERAVDLILMDIDLGAGMDGTEAAREILRLRHLPIVFLTSHSEKEMVEKVRGITRYGYVIKNSGNFVLQSSIEMAFELFEANRKVEKNVKDLEKREFFLNEAERVAELGYYELDILAGRWISSEMLDNIFGISKEYDRTVEGWLHFIHPEFKTIMADYFLNYVIGQKQRFNKEYKICKFNSGEVRWVNGLGELEFDPAGIPVKMFGTIQDITFKKNTELILKNLVEEKELLLREVHHRIKNNMSTIRSFLELQSTTSSDSNESCILKEAESRVQGMIVLYDKLSCSSDFSEISFEEYFSPLVDDIIKIFPFQKTLKIKKDFENFKLDAKLIFTLGIILNELLTNIMKYAFVGRNEGEILITASIIEQHVKVLLHDNGVGLPDEFDLTHSKSFGLTIVKLLIEQLRGSFSIENNKGTRCVLEFDINNK